MWFLGSTAKFKMYIKSSVMCKMGWGTFCSHLLLEEKSIHLKSNNNTTFYFVKIAVLIPVKS